MQTADKCSRGLWTRHSWARALVSRRENSQKKRGKKPRPLSEQRKHANLISFKYQDGRWQDRCAGRRCGWRNQGGGPDGARRHPFSITAIVPTGARVGMIITTKNHFLREYILPPNAARDSAPQGRYAVAVFLQRAQSHHNWRLTKGSVRAKVRNPAPRTRARAAS